MSPSISVIVPCYNAEAYLAEALDSLFVQQVDGLDIIVVDDGSTDNSAAIAASYGNRLHYVYQENQGISAARNCGLQLARGELITFLDADDLWPANSLAIRLQYLTEHVDLDGVFGQVDCFISPELRDTLQNKLLCPPITAGRMASALLLRKQVFQRVGWFDTQLQVGEHLDWIARADAVGITMAGVDAVVLRRRLHNSNTTQQTQRLHADYLTLLRAAISRRRSQVD